MVALVACLVVLPALASGGKTHEMTVELVSFDAKTKTMQFKTDKGETKSAPVMDSAVSSLSAMKAGDKVTITCSDNDKGEHQGVSMAKMAAAPKHG
jgi:hypothetical protein